MVVVVDASVPSARGVNYYYYYDDDVREKNVVLVLALHSSH